MRRIVLALVLITFAVPAFADDAKVLPAGILRTTVVPAFIVSNNQFGTDFEMDRSSATETKFFNLGIALEYGVTDWITAAVQWAPGWTAWSSVDPDVGNPLFDDADVDAVLHRFFDMFAGAKVQIIGENAPVRRSDMRFAFAPGLKFPLGYPDWDGQYDGAVSSQDVELDDPYVFATPQRGPDTNAFGVGARVYYDYIFNENWFINFFSEAGVYLRDARAPNLPYHLIAELLNDLDEDYDTDEFGYGWDIQFEIEPHFETMLGEGLLFGASLPINIDYLPEITLGGDKLSDIAADMVAKYEGPAPDAAAAIDNAWGDEGPSSLLTVGPTMKLFARTWPVPTEFVATYSIPVAGRRVGASHVFSLQIRNYLSF